MHNRPRYMSVGCEFRAFECCSTRTREVPRHIFLAPKEALNAVVKANPPTSSQRAVQHSAVPRVPTSSRREQRGAPFHRSGNDTLFTCPTRWASKTFHNRCAYNGTRCSSSAIAQGKSRDKASSVQRHGSNPCSRCFVPFCVYAHDSFRRESVAHPCRRRFCCCPRRIHPGEHMFCGGVVRSMRTCSSWRLRKPVPRYNDAPGHVLVVPTKRGGWRTQRQSVLFRKNRVNGGVLLAPYNAPPMRPRPLVHLTQQSGTI